MDMQLEEKIANRILIEEIRKEIDFEVMKDLYLDVGGVYVSIRRNIRRPRDPSIVREGDAELVAKATEWCKTYCVGGYYGNWLDWVFQHGADATLFALKFA